MNFSSFEEYEQSIQQKYDDIKMPYDPCIVLSVTLLGFRNVSDGFFDYFDTPDPQFTVTCPKIQQPTLRSFKTQNIPNNVTEGEINRTFCFVMPEDINPNDEFPVEIKLVERDIMFDDIIGEKKFDASKLELDGKPTSMKLNFGDGQKTGELDIVMQKQTRNYPDVRFSLGLCTAEREFRKKRIPMVCKAMNKILEKEQAPRNEMETPVVSLVGSGGGYRSVIALCGAMEALHEAGIVDTLTYTASLSGGAWYFAAAHGLEGLFSDTYMGFHNRLRRNMAENLFWDFVNPLTINDYKSVADQYFNKVSLPDTFVNFFPGYLVTKHLYGNDKIKMTLSDFSEVVDTAQVPYPLVSALHVRNKVAAHRYHAYAERTPHEIYFPSYGVGLKPEDEGACWSNGVKLRSGHEFPMFFTVGMTGCAFSILLNQYFKYGDEAGNSIFNALDDIRLKRRDKTSESDINLSSDDEDDDDLAENTMEPNAAALSPIHKMYRSESLVERVAAKALIAPSTPTTPLTPKFSDILSIVNSIKKSAIFTTRNAFIGRTAKTPNFSRNCKWKRYYMNPFIKKLTLNDDQKELIKLAGYKFTSSSAQMPQRTENLSFVDSGILKNVPTEAVLRPQRGTDVMIVIDANGYDDDNGFDYQPLLGAAAHAAQTGIKFPKIRYMEILKTPPKELLILPSDEEGCPTVLWFTLCNKRFKNLENYTPRTIIPPPGKQKNSKFNDFKVYGEGSRYSTFKFHYEQYHFDQLRELMHFNVNSHIKEIKQALADATARKRQNLTR